MTHDKGNLLEYEELPVHCDTTCYKSNIKRKYFPIDSLPLPRNCQSVQVLWSLLAIYDLSINISNVWIQHPSWCRVNQLCQTII